MGPLLLGSTVLERGLQGPARSMLAKQQGGFSMRGAKPKLWAPFSCKSRTENLEPISCLWGWRGQGPSAEESKMGREGALVPILPQHAAPRNPGLVGWGSRRAAWHQGQDDTGEPLNRGACTSRAQRLSLPIWSWDGVAQNRGFGGAQGPLSGSLGPSCPLPPHGLLAICSTSWTSE